ncbi:MAG: PAS domain S-box protein [Chloroflexota bacterium]|nr:PAS domain S-box protein [Chloroflexota bacterium]
MTTRRSDSQKLSGPHRLRAVGLIVALFTIVSVLHYAEQLRIPWSTPPSGHFGFTRHAVDRVLFLVPIGYAGFVFGAMGGIAAVVAALLLMLPRAILISPAPYDALVETLVVSSIGTFLVLWYEGQLRLKRQRQEASSLLEASQRELRSQVQVAKANERRLATANAVAGAVSQSLELESVLKTVADMLTEVMVADIALIYLLDESQGEIVLEVHKGVSEEFAAQVRRMKVGEGLNGSVAATGRPMVVCDVASLPVSTREAVLRERIRSELIAPLRAKGRVVGTATVAVRRDRRFLPEDVELLSLIGNQVGVAIENARLYEQERQISEQLRVSERSYRELFERARDAIWVQDLGGMILTANPAFARITGYSREELVGMQASNLLPESPAALEARIHLLQGKVLERPLEQRSRRKDGTEAILELNVSLIFDEGRPRALQYIGRDQTAEKQLQEALRFYHQEVTRAQEEERKRIARELHDDTAQRLVALSHQLDSLASTEERLSMPGGKLLEELHQQVDDLLASVRHFARELRPSVLDDLGFIPALEGLASDVVEGHGIHVNVQVMGEVRRLGSEAEVGLFRIVQEALRNVWKHAEASTADVTVEFSSNLVRVTVRDNGKGFRLPGRVADLARSRKLGLVGMEERARLLGGHLHLESQPGKGTVVCVAVAA